MVSAWIFRNGKDRGELDQMFVYKALKQPENNQKRTPSHKLLILLKILQNRINTIQENDGCYGHFTGFYI